VIIATPPATGEWTGNKKSSIMTGRAGTVARRL
jgi:hypothetical protein